MLAVTLERVCESIEGVHSVGKDGEQLLFKRPANWQEQRFAHHLPGRTCGDGSQANPYSCTLKGISTFYLILELWVAHRGDRWEPFIGAGGHVFRARKEGVLAADGTFTKLLPPE